jgi:ABC-type branched-subunit amino acid transport system substrate-binding protein
MSLLRRLGLTALVLLGGWAWAGELPDVVVRSLSAASPKAATVLLQEGLAEKGLPEADRAWIELYLAENLRLSGSLTEARSQFELVGVNYPGHRARNAAVVGMAVIDAKGKPTGNVRATLELIAEEGLPASLNADRFLLLAGVASREGNGDKQRAYSEKAEGYAASSPKESAKRVRQGLNELPVAAASPMPSNLPPDEEALRRMRQALGSGDLPAAKEEAAAFLQKFPDSPFAAEAQVMARREVTPVRKRVAVLLPSSGTYAPVGKNLKIALELAAGRNDSAVELQFFDTAGSGDTCVAKLEEAVLQKGASWVIGPLLKDEAAKCAPAAQALGVPMLVLTAWEGVVDVGDHIYRAYPSTGQLLEALLHETVDVRGMKRYAAVYPKNPYGENAMAGFEAALKERGCTLVASVSYDPTAVDFRKTAAALKAKDPSLGYDALFIPDAYARVALLAPALAFEELPVGRFRPKAGVTPITLLGLNGWDHPDLPRRGGTYVQDSIFLDAFDAGSEDVWVSEFVTAYREAAGGEPTLVEAVGYDTVRLLSAAVMVEEGDLLVALKKAELTSPVAGTRMVEEDREVGRSWRMLTITSSGIEPLPSWVPPPPPTE